MNRHAEYESLAALIAAHQTAEVECGAVASPAPPAAGREVTPSPASRPAIHCWEDGGHSTCLLADGHDGPHEFTPDSEIVVRFA